MVLQILFLEKKWQESFKFISNYDHQINKWFEDNKKLI